MWRIEALDRIGQVAAIRTQSEGESNEGSDINTISYTDDEIVQESRAHAQEPHSKSQARVARGPIQSLPLVPLWAGRCLSTTQRER